MKEHPITLTWPEVRAILDGSKTQHRTVVKPQPPDDVGKIIGPEIYWPAIIRKGRLAGGKEIFGIYSEDGDWGAKCPWRIGDRLLVKGTDIALEIVGIRAERLHDIGKDGRKATGVLAEGITVEAIKREQEWYHPDDAPSIAYCRLWDSINEARGYGWKSNSLCWVLEFKRITP